MEDVHATDSKIPLPKSIAQTNHMDYEYDTLMSMLQTSVSKHLLDEHYTLIWANEFYYKTIEYPKEEYIAKFHNRPDLYYPDHGYGDELQKLTAAVVSALAAGEPGYSLVTRLPVKSGGHIWVRMVGTFADEYVDGYQVSYTAITNIDDLIRMEQDQSTVYNSIPGFVSRCLFKRNHKIEVLESNDQFNEFFGHPKNNQIFQTLLNQNWKDNLEIISQQFEQADRGEPVQMLLKLYGKHGNYAWLQVRGECVDWLDDEPVYLLIYIDVTDLTDSQEMQKKLQDQARQLKTALSAAEYANRAKSDFLSRMSHDIRTPMNAIMGMTEVASGHLDNSDKVKNCLQKIALSSKHLLGLINDVLDMSKIESGKMLINYDVTSLPEVLENSVAIIQPSIKTHGQNFSVRLSNVRHEHVISDALRLRQIFINILSNASKFTPDGGSITMAVTESDNSESGIYHFQFVFTDTGVGISPEFINTLFNPFTRERDSRIDKTEGSGLGMAITKKIVELLGGTIEVDSQVDQGTVFTVCLPFQAVAEPEELPSDLPPLHILIADDDEAMHEHILHTLNELGVRGDWASNGKQVLERMQTAQEHGDSYDVVILDWRMPELDGVETARQIRCKYGVQLPLLMISAYDWSDIAEKAVSAGVSGFLTKPLFASTLYRGLKKYVLHQDIETLDAKQIYDFTGKRLLVVEDNELNREVAVSLLSDAGADVICAVNGKEGISLFQESKENYYDLILMDIQMPVMDGYTATRLIRTMPRTDAAVIPILAMTADAFAEDVTAAIDAGMNGHLAKPLDITSMKQEIYKLLK